MAEDIWFIKGGNPIDFNVGNIYSGIAPGKVDSFQISDLADYMIRPEKISIKKKIIGCEVLPKRTMKQKAFKKFNKYLPKRMQGNHEPKPVPNIVRGFEHIPMADENLDNYFSAMSFIMKGYHPMLKYLKELDLSEVKEIGGYCEEPGGGYSYFNIAGTLENKVDFLATNIESELAINYDSAYQGKGIFDMRGYDMAKFDLANKIKMCRFIQNGMPKGCTITAINQEDYFIADADQMDYLQLLQKAVDSNPDMMAAFEQCKTGETIPLRLHFNPQPALIYSEEVMPQLVKDMLLKHKRSVDDRKALIYPLQKAQFAVTFNHQSVEDKRIFSEVSVLHNLKALDPIKNRMMDVYEDLKKESTLTGIGDYYPLDSARGVIQ